MPEARPYPFWVLLLFARQLTPMTVETAMLGADLLVPFLGKVKLRFLGFTLEKVLK